MTGSKTTGTSQVGTRRAPSRREDRTRAVEQLLGILLGMIRRRGYLGAVLARFDGLELPPPVQDGNGQLARPDVNSQSEFLTSCTHERESISRSVKCKPH